MKKKKTKGGENKMAKKKKHLSKFRKKVATDSHKQKVQTTQYGHLRLPKNVSIFKEEPGSRVRLDILPYYVTDPNHPDRDDELEIALPGTLWYKRPYKLHRGVGVDNQSIVCPTSVGKPCPICEYRAQKLKEGDDSEEIRALKPSLRNLYVVVPKDSKTYEEKPHIWDISQYLFQNQLNEEIEENEEYAAFPDLEEGYTLRIRFSEETFHKNKFASTSRIDFEERDEPYDESILNEVPNLDEALDILSYSKIEALFFGAELNKTEDEDEEDIDLTRVKPLREASFEEDDDKEDEEENNEDEVEELEEEDDEDEEEEEDDEEEEEEEPTPKRKAKKIIPHVEEEEKPRRTRTKTHNKEKEKNKCPYGHKFGEDCEEYDDCDQCEVWEECIEVKEAL